MSTMKSTSLQLLLPSALLFLAGCAATTPISTGTALPGAIQGSVHGGQQPVSGATMQLYAVGTTGDGSAATPLLTSPVLTSANGGFTLTGLFTCPTSSSLVYLVATGGNPGLGSGGANPQLALMAALGTCGNLTPSTFISVNEVTTVAAVYALAPYATGYSSIGSASSDASALASAFLLSGIFADTSAGSSPGPGVPSGYSVPIAQINTIANISSSCINSPGGTIGDSSTCGTFFSLTYPGSGTAPTNTIAALLNLAAHPALNTQALYNLAPPSPPFQPVDTTTPPDLSVHLIPSSSVTLSPLPLSFTSTTVGFLEILPVTVTNGGSAGITISGFSIAGVDPSDFALDTQSSTCSNTLAAGASCIQQIDFTPQAAGARTAYLQVTNSATTSPLTLPMTGTATAGANSGPITLSPSTVAIPLNGYPEILTLTNAGNSTLNINRIVLSESGYSASVTPALTNNFVETNNCGTSLAAQSICTITVTETTGFPGTSATITVYDDAASGPQSATATYGSCPGCTAQTVGTSSQVNNFYIGYAGKGSSAFGSIGFSSPDFTNGSYSCNSLTGGCTGSYTFQPTAPGLRSAAYSTPYGSGSVSGYGFAGPFLNLLYANNALTFFGSFAVGSTSTAGIGLGSSGSGFSPQNPVISGPDAASFSAVFGSQAYCSSIATNCVVVSANPTHAGVNRAVLLISNSTNAGQQYIPLVITATPNAPTVGTIAFPNTQPGSTSPVQNVSISAYNNDAISATITPNPGNNIQFSGSNQCAQTPCQLGLVFSPSAFGTSSATLTVTDTVQHLATTYNFTATSTQVPQLLVSPTSYTFPLRSVNTTSIAQTFTLTANNAASITLSSIALGGANPNDYTLTNNCSSTLAGNSSCTLSVSFAPKSTGTRTATITITSSAPSSPDTITLTGSAN